MARFWDVILKPQDVLVLLKVCLHPEVRWTVRAMGAEVGLSGSEASAATKRLVQARLVVSGAGGRAIPVRESAVEFLVHGVRYIFPAVRGPVTRGIPTAHAAPVLIGNFAKLEGLPPVWPHPEGIARGESFKPLYSSAPKAASRDTAMYAALALIDAIRGGNARERALATKLLSEMIMKAGE